MGVYIKGMEMPTDKAASLIICSSGKVYYDYLEVAGQAVPVPPHGRLIDADKLGFAMMDAANADQALTMVDDAPTVIEAEEGDG